MRRNTLMYYMYCMYSDTLTFFHGKLYIRQTAYINIRNSVKVQKRYEVVICIYNIYRMPTRSYHLKVGNADYKRIDYIFCILYS